MEKDFCLSNLHKAMSIELDPFDQFSTFGKRLVIPDDFNNMLYKAGAFHWPLPLPPPLDPLKDPNHLIQELHDIKDRKQLPRLGSQYRIELRNEPLWPWSTRLSRLVAYIYVVTDELASSESGLDELSDSILQGKTVLPIFHGVDPSDVRNQTGSFAEAFAKHEVKYKDKPQKVERWRAALRKLGSLAGWNSKGWRESELIQDIVQEIRKKLHSTSSKRVKRVITNVPPAPSLPCSRKKHDVFLSFRGTDTRLNFLDHLYAALVQQSIATFRDDKDLDKGISISKQLDKAIERSKVWVVLVSPDYASSKWCLDELLKILECRKAAKVGWKALKHERNAQNWEIRDSLNKGKATDLQNKDKSSGVGRVANLIVTINYDGMWASSVYTGGKSKEIMVAGDISYEELVDQIYCIVGLEPNQNEIKISTLDGSKVPAHPVEITNGDDLKVYIDQCLSLGTSFNDPLQAASKSSMTELRILVNHDGEWINSTYTGGKTKGIVIPENITYQGLVDRMYGVVRADPNEYKLIMKTSYHSSLPTQPVEITSNETLAFFIKENLSLSMKDSKIPLCTSLERRWAFPYGGVKSSENSSTTQYKRFSTYHGNKDVVTHDQVTFVQTEVGSSSSSHVPYLQRQPPSHQQQHHFAQQIVLQPNDEHYQPSYQQLQPPQGQQPYTSYTKLPYPSYHHPTSWGQMPYQPQMFMYPNSYYR